MQVTTNTVGITPASTSIHKLMFKLIRSKTLHSIKILSWENIRLYLVQKTIKVKTLKSLLKSTLFKELCALLSHWHIQIIHTAKNWDQTQIETSQIRSTVFQVWLDWTYPACWTCPPWSACWQWSPLSWPCQVWPHSQLTGTWPSSPRSLFPLHDYCNTSFISSSGIGTWFQATQKCVE